MNYRIFAAAVLLASLLSGCSATILPPDSAYTGPSARPAIDRCPQGQARCQHGE